ncbi:hypothetical protein N9901_00080 [Flavobacteriaceae bacterium]|nr:hypothetical protein [Flavobacteriaceae bacterium]
MNSFNKRKLIELNYDNAVPAMIHRFADKKQKKHFKKIKQQFGDFVKCNYYNNIPVPPFRIYRFKAFFKNYETPLEVRSIFDIDNKLINFSILPWVDQIK